MRIFIVDDVSMNLKIAQSIIEANFEDEFEIVTIKDSVVANERLLTEQVDLVILDLLMPHMTGLDILSNLRKAGRLNDIKVVMFTSFDDKQTLKECFDMGASDFILKPIEEVEFVARLRNAMNEHNFNKKIKDINKELTTLNQQLQETQIQLVQQEKLAGIGHLAAGLAHEINNPLGYIFSNITVLKQYFHDNTSFYQRFMKFYADLDDKHAKAVLETFIDKDETDDFKYMISEAEQIFVDIEEGLMRVRHIISELREFSKIDEFSPDSIYYISESVKNVVNMISSQEKGNIEFKFDLDDDLYVNVFGGEVNQVILNIITNSIEAIKRSGNEDGKITIRTYADPDYVCCSIEDNGDGMSEEVKRNALNMFYTTKELGEGRGTGMSVAYGIIVKRHKGDFLYDSIEGRGTKVIIKIPLKSDTNYS